MAANELFQKRYARLAFQVSLLYISIFFFAIYIVPLAVHSIGAWVFLLSGVVSLGILWLFIKILQRFAGERLERSRTVLLRAIAGIFIAINFLYFTNLIPPIPLSLKDAGIYHSVSRGAGGSYVVEREDKGFLDYFRLRERVHWSPGQTLYAYSAVFSPAALNTNIVHEWQYKNPSTGRWTTSSRVPLSVSGGRGEGFRTYSAKSSLSPGLWRVNVATPRGQLIGRVTFRIVEAGPPPELERLIKD